MTTSPKFVYLILPLLQLLSREGRAVTVLSVGLSSGDATLPLHADKKAELECRYKLDENETLEELVWVRDGKMLRSIDSEQPPCVELSDFYNITNPGRNSTGVYRCTVRTKQGDNDTGRFELFVIDILKNSYTSGTSRKNCSYVINYSTPYAYPRGSAFCGIWIPDSEDGNGTWLEAPEDRKESNMEDGSPMPVLSYSSDRGDFTEGMDAEMRTRFLLEDKKIAVKDTPMNSTVKCTFGFYSPTGRFYPSSQIETSSYSDFFDSSCMEEVPKKFVTERVSLEFSAYTHDCYGRIVSSMTSRDLTATLRCTRTNKFEVLVCKNDVWQRQMENKLMREFENILEEFIESCDVEETDDEEDSANVAALSVMLCALCMLTSLRRLHAL